MAEQVVRLESDSGSKERVALDLMKFITTHVSGSMPKSKSEALNLYADCYQVTQGYRSKE